MGFFKKIFKGGGIGGLIGGPLGATAGLLGKKGLGGIFKGKPDTMGVSDVRSPAERALQESQVGYFQGLMGQPDMGFQAEETAQDPIYARARGRLQEQVSGVAAEKGFGMLQHGPSVSAFARGAQEMEENRAGGTAERRDAYRRWVMSQGRESSMPVGRSSYVQQGRPSYFSMLAKPFMGAAGTAMGGPIGGVIGQGFADMIPTGQRTIRPDSASMSDQLRSRGGYN